MANIYFYYMQVHPNNKFKINIECLALSFGVLCHPKYYWRRLTIVLQVIYGGSIQSKYTHWNCSSYLSCYGACFVSAQITKDLITPTSPSEMSLTNRVRRSDIVILKFVNPAENTIVTMETLITPVILSVSVIGDVNTTAYGLQVYWNTTHVLYIRPFVFSYRFLNWIQIQYEFLLFLFCSSVILSKTRH